MNLDFFISLKKKHPISDFIKIRSAGFVSCGQTDGWTDGQTDRHDEVSSLFSDFVNSSRKWNLAKSVAP